MAPVRVLFSDLDGTLAHYEKDMKEYASIVGEPAKDGSVTIEYNQLGVQRECAVLGSLSSSTAYMSHETTRLVQHLRAAGVLIVIITGARSSTYLGRRAALPAADYEFFENGGRMLASGELVPEWTATFADDVGPVKATIESGDDAAPPPSDRTGKLWDLYREMKEAGWKVDARDYYTSFRVDVAGTTAAGLDDAAFAAWDFRGLTYSFNLGKADIYPAMSGKAAAAKEVLRRHGLRPAHSVAMFDDHNDLELGELASRSFLPGVTHDSVLDALRRHDNWEMTNSRGVLGTEEALAAVMRLVAAGDAVEEPPPVDDGGGAAAPAGGDGEGEEDVPVGAATASSIEISREP